jgi:hypothetical protein
MWSVLLYCSTVQSEPCRCVTHCYRMHITFSILQVSATEESLVTLWNATFAPPVDLPGSLYSNGLAARKRLLPIIQVQVHELLPQSSYFSSLIFPVRSIFVYLEVCKDNVST